MLRISPGREEEFRYFQRWLEASASLERVIEATEEDSDSSSSAAPAATDKALSQPVINLGLRREPVGLTGVPRPLSRRSGQGRSAMWVHLYAEEKLRELERERLARIRYVQLDVTSTPTLPVFGRAAAAAGRTLRRAGEAMELWATPSNERERLRVALARARRSD